MLGHGLVTSIFQLLLLVLSNHNLIIVSVFCERTVEGKPQTKVEIEVKYLNRQQEEKPYASRNTPSYKIINFNYNIPKSVSPDNRANGRHSNINNGASPRQGFRFSSTDKNPGDNTVPTFDGDGSDINSRMRNNQFVAGQLIHVVSVQDRPSDNSSTLFLSNTACDETINSVQGNWVALVQGGSCSFDRKIKHIMKMSNTPATILIYGNSIIPNKLESYVSLHNDDAPMVIHLPLSNINEVVQRCNHSRGQLIISPDILLKLNRSGSDWSMSNQNYCNVTIKVYTSNEDNFLNKTSVLFVSISFILLMVISLAWLMFYYVQRFRYIHTKEQFSRRLAHMAKKAVAKIPVKTLKHGDRETDPDIDNCAICIECYKPSDTVRILPCKHYFHKSCIDPWLLEQRSCPMCKLNILHAYGFLPNERGSMISEDRLSELDSSLELQFLSGNIVPPLPGTSTRVQAYCQARDSNYINVAALPPIFTERGCRNNSRWASLRLKRPQRVSHRIDRSVSLRHLSGSAEERITFLSHNRVLSHSATDTAVIVQDPSTPHLPTLQWQQTSTSSVTAAVEPGSQSSIYSH